MFYVERPMFPLKKIVAAREDSVTDTDAVDTMVGYLAMNDGAELAGLRPPSNRIGRV